MSGQSRQRKIIERYYEHKETIQANKLAEIVSNLYLSEGGSPAKLWERAGKALEAAGVDPAKAREIVRSKDLEALAKLAGQLSVGGVKPKDK